MTKLESLYHIQSTIEPVRKKLLLHVLYAKLSQRKRKQVLCQAGELSLLEEELMQHIIWLTSTQTACKHGQMGSAPDDWDGWKRGEKYDAYQEIIECLKLLPAQALSAELHAYIGQLPSKNAREYDELMSHLQVITMLVDDGPLQGVTDEEIVEEGQEQYYENMQATFFAGEYAGNLSQARQLAEEQGDLNSIWELLN